MIAASRALLPLLTSLLVSAAAVLATPPTSAGDEIPGVEPWWTLIDAESLEAADRPIEDVVDYYVDLALERHGITAAPRASDAVLVRRLTLDLCSRVPTVAETRAYLESDDADRRATLVDRLMSSPAFRRHQTAEFDALLGDRSSLEEYLARAFEEGRSWDRLFRELIVAPRGDATKGAESFLRDRVKDIDKLTNDVSVSFFGVNVSCAKCHDHPYVPSWTQDQYYGMKSFFARSFENGGFVGERDYGFVTYKTNSGESRRAQPRFLSGRPIDEPEAPEPTKEERKREKERLEKLKKEKKPPPPPSFSRRALLVEAALEEERAEQAGYFARAIVNRIWHRFFGRGLVMPLDQMHGANRPSHPELLEWLSRDLIAHGYDLRRLIRGLVLSRAYSRTSLRGDGDPPPPSSFAVASVRPLTPRQYGVSLRLVTTDPETLSGLSPEQLEERLVGIERSGEGLAQWFERPGENFQVSVDEALALSNNERVERELLETRSGLIGHLMEIDSIEERVATAVWTALSRPATEHEIRLLTDYLNERADRPGEACRQVVWALVTGSEFRFNH